MHWLAQQGSWFEEREEAVGSEVNHQVSFSGETDMFRAAILAIALLAVSLAATPALAGHHPGCCCVQCRPYPSLYHDYWYGYRPYSYHSLYGRYSPYPYHHPYYRSYRYPRAGFGIHGRHFSLHFGF